MEEDVDIETLKLLNEEDLVRLGIKLGPRKALLSALADASKVRRLSAPRDISHQGALLLLLLSLLFLLL